MKRFIYHITLFLVYAFAFSSCGDDATSSFDPVAQAAKDEDLIKEYIAKDTAATKFTPVRLEKGVYYIQLKPGNGPQVVNGNLVKMQYVGRFLNGTKFESSWDRNTPISFRVGVQEVIEGWDLGLPLMRLHEKARFYIPSGLAYGQLGTKIIPPNAVLVFDVDVLEIK